jgi:hypothetical protein
MKTDIDKRNKSGANDPTPYQAIRNIERRSRKPRPVSEAREQALVFEWVGWNMRQYPELWFLHHVPNGGSRNKAEAVNLKKQGVKAGVSDLFLPVARQGFHGLYIELKAIGGRISKPQAEWINRVRTQGYAAFDCWSADEAIERLEWYLGGAK